MSSIRKPSEFVGHLASYDEARALGYFRTVSKKVVDGDTYDFLIDLGMGMYAYQAIRLNGLDVYERNTVLGTAGTMRAEELILNKSTMIRTWRETRTFERYAADVVYPDGDGHWISLADTLRAEGFEKPRAP